MFIIFTLLLTSCEKSEGQTVSDIVKKQNEQFKIADFPAPFSQSEVNKWRLTGKIAREQFPGK